MLLHPSLLKRGSADLAYKNGNHFDWALVLELHCSQEA
jgi:hypothetical protein